MNRQKRIRVKSFLTGVISFIIVFVVAFFGIQFFTKTGIFRIPGVVYYDDSLSQSELDKLNAIFTDEVDLDKDVHISAHEVTELGNLTEGEFLIDISVPVTDFYESRSDTSDFNENEYDFISINDLDFSKKL